MYQLSKCLKKLYLRNIKSGEGNVHVPLQRISWNCTYHLKPNYFQGIYNKLFLKNNDSEYNTQNLSIILFLSTERCEVLSVETVCA